MESVALAALLLAALAVRAVAWLTRWVERRAAAQSDAQRALVEWARQAGAARRRIEARQRRARTRLRVYQLRHDGRHPAA